MTKLVAVILFLHSLMLSFGQNADIKSMVDSLSYLTVDTLDCNADLYWRIVAKGQTAIPFLIDKLTDTTQTKVKFHCKKTALNVGEVAHFALTQIAEFPPFLVTKIQFDVINIGAAGQPCWNFYNFLFINANKMRYQTDVINWYSKQKSNYKAKKIPKRKQTACQMLYGVDRYYRWGE